MDLGEIVGFDWDENNIYKNVGKHNVYSSEAEQIFFNHPVVIRPDLLHSQSEKRLYALGHTQNDRKLFIAFTLRSNRIRVISARDMTRTSFKEIPKFKTEVEEREFWAAHDSTEYLDWDEAEVARFPNLKPTTKSISIRLPQDLIDDLKILANKRDVPYQSLLKVLLAEKIQDEFGRRPLTK